MPGIAILKRLFSTLVLVAAFALAAQLVVDLNRVKALKTDLAEINHVHYGLFDADEWVARISAIVAKRINEFELTEVNRPQIVKAVAQVLDTMLVEIERYLRRRNLSGGGTWMDQLQGVLQQGVQDLLIDFDKLRKRVPQYAEAVVDQLSRPEAKQEIREQLLSLIQQTAGSAFAKTDRSGLIALYGRYDCNAIDPCSRQIEQRIDAARMPIRAQLGALIGLVAMLFLVCLTGRRGVSLADPSDTAEDGASGVGAAARFDPFKLFLISAATLVLLAGGILTPMIEIEARVSELRLEFMGEPLAFTNQVLYYQSKSIFEVVRILAEAGAADMWLVAVLIVLFSVVFPALKLIGTYLYYYDFRQARSSAWVRFFALRSGKWSMADVMVVAIFMAFIGFDGLVGSQMRSLARAGTEPSTGAGPLGSSLLTTNGTSLEPGFYLFLSFVLASLLLSGILERRLGPAARSR